MDKVSVRYIVANVDAAIPFYTEVLGFQVDMHPAPGFASLSKGNLQLLLNQPGAGGPGQAMPDGQVPAPGGWKQIQVEVQDLSATVEKLKRAGCRFRNEIVVGKGGKPEPAEIKLSHFHMASSAVRPSPSQLEEQFREACPARLNPN
jgi:catechol 2,3-dioxygenase-like lactoylglutathione lyase family enzyme